MSRTLCFGAACCLAGAWCMAQPVFPPECPRRGTLEIVEDPARWADQCFAAIHGRLPTPGIVGETASAMRDLDLDESPERLEIRGTGQSMKQIYVFRSTPSGFVYLGELRAHSSFKVTADADGSATISYVYSAGADNLTLINLKYLDSEYLEVGSEKIGARTLP